MVTTRAFALRDAGGCYACQMPIDGERFRCRSPFLFHNLTTTMQFCTVVFLCLLLTA
nr:MAG TPA: zinc finger protein [Caudoviricetes sp.]